MIAQEAGSSTSKTIGPRLYDFLLPTCLFLLTIVLILLASVPPVSRDALVHHLAVPKLYLSYGRMIELPWLEFSYYPMNMDLLYIVPLFFNFAIGAKYIHLSFAILTAITLYCYLSKLITRNYAILGMILFLTTPIVVKLSTTAYVDLGLTFFSFTALILLFEWRNNEFRSRYLVLAGISCGLALGVKYTGYISFLFFLGLIPFLVSSSSRSHAKAIHSRQLRAILIFFTISIITVSPWLIRNALWTGNPVYPMFNTLFSNQETSFTIEQSPFVIRKIIYNESWWETLLIPVRIFFQGQDNNPALFDGVLNPFYLFFIPFIFITHKKVVVLDQDTFYLIIYCFFFLFFVFFFRDMRIRYLAPIIPVLVIILTLGLKNCYFLISRNITIKNKKLIKTVILIISVIILIPNALYMVREYKKIDPIGYISGKVSREEYISQRVAEYPVINYSNTHLNNNAKLLCVFLGNRGYYLDKDHRFDKSGGISQLQTLLSSTPEPGLLLDDLTNLGYTHLLIRTDLWDIWSRRELSQTQRDVFNIFLQKYTNLQYHYRNFSLFMLKTRMSPNFDDNS